MKTRTIAVTVTVELDEDSSLAAEQAAEAVSGRITAFLYPVGIRVTSAIASVVSEQEIAF